MTDAEKRTYKKWASLLTREALEKEYNKVKKMKFTDASSFMKSICEEERKYRDKIIGL